MMELVSDIFIDILFWAFRNIIMWVALFNLMSKK